MIIKNVRVGSDSGFACGPCGGSDYVEVMAQEENGESVYVLVSVYEEFEKVEIASVPLFDLVLHMMSSHGDFGTEFEELQSLVTDELDYECRDAVEVLAGHPYEKLIHAARLVMAMYLAADWNEEDEKLKELIQMLTGRDPETSTMLVVDSVLPVQSADEDEEEEEE